MNRKAIIIGIYYLLRKISIFGKTYPLPSAVHLVITRRCNLKCGQCQAWMKTGQELSHENWLYILTELRKWLGPFHLTICGGEPLVRKDIARIVAAASQNGLMTNMTTNGTLLDSEMIAALKAAGLDTITVSLDAITPSTYAWLRGREFSVYDIMKNILASKSYIKTRLAITLMNQNHKEVMQLIDWAHSNRLDGVRIQAYFHGFSNDRDCQQFAPNNNQGIQILREIIDRKNNGYRVLNSMAHLKQIMAMYSGKKTSGSCSLGSGNIRFNPDASIQLCRKKLIVKNHSRSEMENSWNSKEVQNALSKARACSEKCALLNCNFRLSLLDKMRLALRS